MGPPPRAGRSRLRCPAWGRGSGGPGRGSAWSPPLSVAPASANPKDRALPFCVPKVSAQRGGGAKESSREARSGPSSCQSCQSGDTAQDSRSVAPSEGLTSRLGGWQGSVSAQSHLSTGMPHLLTPVGAAGCAGSLDTGAHPHPWRGPGPARTHELGHTRQRSGRGLSWPPLRMPKARQGGLRGGRPARGPPLPPRPRGLRAHPPACPLHLP